MALRLLGIFLTASGLSAFASTFGQNGFRGIGNWSLYLGFFIYLLTGLIVLLKAETLSKYMLPINDSAITELKITENFQAAALRVAGIYISASAIPSVLHLAGRIIEYKYFKTEIPEYLKENPNFIIPLLSETIYFLIGVFLAMGPRSLLKVLSRFDKTIEKMST